MFTSTLSATTWYADVALIALLVLFALMGIIRGFGKSMKGIFMTITVILGSLLIMGLLHETVLDSTIGQSLSSAIGGASANWGVEFNEILYEEEGVRYILVDGARQNLADLGLKGTLADKIAGLLISEYGVYSLAGVCVQNITSLIIAICLFVVCCIVLSILCSVVKGMTKGMHNSDSRAVRAVDKTLGGIVSLVLGAVFIMLILAIFKALETRVPIIAEYINQSTVCKYFYDLNPLGKVFASIFS